MVTDETQRDGHTRRGASQFGMINDAEQGGPKTSCTWRIMAAASSLPQFVAQANPILASKLAFVIWNASTEFHFTFAEYNPNPSRETKTGTQNASHHSALVPISAHPHLPRSEGFTFVPLLVFGSWWMHSPHYICCWSQSEGTRSHTGPGTELLLRHSGNMLEICWAHVFPLYSTKHYCCCPIPCLIPFVKPIDQHFPRIAIGNVPQFPK